MMASVHGTLTSVVCKKGNHSANAKLPSNAFLTRINVVGRPKVWKKEACPATAGPKATLTFDPPTTNTEKTQRKHTVDPAAPDFLPLPSFEQCFPRSSKEYRSASGCLLSINILLMTNCWWYRVV